MAQVFVSMRTPQGAAKNDPFRAFSEDATC